MRKKKCLILICLFLLIFSSSFVVNQSISSVGTTGQSLKRFNTHNYTFIWEEYLNAPGNQQGDDSLVFGPSFASYHNYTELVAKLQSLNVNFPEIIELFSIGKTYFGKEIYGVRITDELVDDSSKSEVLIVAQHHAREQITVENALYFIDKMVNDSLDPSSGISALLSQKAIFVIPSLNIDGAELMSKYPWQRKTARPVDEDGDGTDDEFEASDINGDGYIERLYRNFGDYSNPDWRIVGHEGIDLDGDGTIGEDAPGGVDPNRNYPIQFGNQSGASSDPRAEDYHGSAPFSENCTARLRDFVLERNFVTALSLHSGIFMIIPPWGWSNKYPEGKGGEVHNTTGQQFEALTGIPYDHLYPCSGDWGDWLYGRENTPTKIAFTIETYMDENALDGEFNSTTQIYHERGIWDMFNPPADQVMDNCRRLYPGLLYLIEFDYPSSVSGFELWIFIPVIAAVAAFTVFRRKKEN